MSKYIPVLKVHHTGQRYWQVEAADRPGVSVGCLSFLHPAHGEAMAQLHAIKWSDLGVYNVVISLIFRAYEKKPAIHARIRRAGFLVLDRKVHIDLGHDPNHHAIVLSQSGSGRYQVDHDENGSTCTCPDFANGAPRVQFRGRTQPVCKHLLAWGIAVKTGQIIDPKDEAVRQEAQARQKQTSEELVEANYRAACRRRGRTFARIRRQQEETGRPALEVEQPF